MEGIDLAGSVHIYTQCTQLFNVITNTSSQMKWEINFPIIIKKQNIICKTIQFSATPWLHFYGTLTKTLHNPLTIGLPSFVSLWKPCHIHIHSIKTETDFSSFPFGIQFDFKRLGQVIYYKKLMKLCKSKWNNWAHQWIILIILILNLIFHVAVLLSLVSTYDKFLN